MSMTFCEECDRYIDTDFDVEHLDECKQDEPELPSKTTGNSALTNESEQDNGHN